MTGKFCCNDGHSCDVPEPRYTLAFGVLDHTCHQYINAFDEAGHAFLQCGEVNNDQATASHLHEAWQKKEIDQTAEAFIENLFTKPLFTRWSVTLKVTKEQYQGNENIKLNVLSAEMLSPTEEGKKITDKYKSVYNGIYAQRLRAKGIGV